MNNEEKQRNYELAEKLVSEQNFAAAVIVGAVAAILGAAAYGITVATWPFSYGFAAAGVGIVVGLSMQFLGRGISTKFAVAAALYTIAGCFLGNVFRVMLELAPANATSQIDILRGIFPAGARRAGSFLHFLDRPCILVCRCLFCGFPGQEAAVSLAAIGPRLV